MLKTKASTMSEPHPAYHLGEGRVLKTIQYLGNVTSSAYHLGEGRVLKTIHPSRYFMHKAYHLGEGRVLKTICGYECRH